jgi:peptidoglycan hydrolase-like protein with peptidoglycan-binding domain
VHSVPARSRQATPMPDRYQEIQQALASKGYLPAEQANGQWSDGSQAALKRFQADQNLEPSGKINSLSLIALGLGPKHEPDKPVGTAPEAPR